MADLQKLVEELSALTVMEAAELKKMLEEAWGVEAAAPMAMGAMPMMMGGGAPAAAAEEEEEKTEFDVILKDIGPKKIEVKVVRALTWPEEAKDLVEGVPSNVMEAVSKEATNDAKASSRKRRGHRGQVTSLPSIEQHANRRLRAKSPVFDSSGRPATRDAAARWGPGRWTPVAAPRRLSH